MRRNTNYFKFFLYWLLNIDVSSKGSSNNDIGIFRLIIFITFHLGCFAILWVGFSWFAFLFTITLYFVRMFFITAFYHRYFSHRSYKTSRIIQFIMAIMGCTAGQRGPIWWASHHREHHITSDTVDDPHSPRFGFLNSHMLWFLKTKNSRILNHRVNDWLRYPELVILEYTDWIPFVAFGIFCYLFGELTVLSDFGIQTSGAQLFVWGFILSTVMLYHGTYTINSLAHRFGKKRYETNDDSKNNFMLALLTLGEGWHNNHHRYPRSAKQGFFWWEIDLTYLFLKFMKFIFLIKDLEKVPPNLLSKSKFES